jgi:hypothetical protein
MASHPTNVILAMLLREPHILRIGFNPLSITVQQMHLYKLKLNSVALVRERTIPTERPPPVGEVSANFLRGEGCHVVSATVPTAVNLCFLDLEPLLF